MTVDEIVERILNEEKEGTPPYLVEGDKGGRTSWGISEKAHPEAWVNGPPSRAAAKEIYQNRYIAPFGWVRCEPLKIALVDFGVVHGVVQATKCLQVLIGVTPDAIMGSKTRYWAEKIWLQRRGGVLLTNALVASRLSIIDTMTDAEKGQKKFEEGWESRALRTLTI